MAVIEVEDLAIGYDDEPVLEHLTFEVADGDIFFVIGGSGSGKSTLLRALVGLLPPLRGRVRVADGESAAARRAPPSLGVVFQSGGLFGSMTLAENVALPLEAWTDLDAAAIETIVCSKLDLVGLRGAEHRLPAEASGGMVKRAGIARALALEPRLLVLDEPSAGLDPVVSAEIDDLVLALNRSLGTTFVIVSHELASILTIGRHCIMLDREARGIIARGDPRQLAARAEDPRVRRFFDRMPARR
ncbi:MAG TPA: ATP-binding cassette domain-containing protein [Thermodesulfobacteriota bacterium]